MNNEREGWEFRKSTIETNSKDETQNKGNKKNNYKYKDNERNYEYGPYKKHIKKNEYVDKGRINNENPVYKKNHKKKRENYDINDRYSENIEEFDINNQIQQDERTKHKNYTQLQSNNTKKNYYNHNNNNQINNINNNTNSNLNNSNEQNQQKNINQFNYYQDNQINNLNYINNNNNNNNNKNGLIKNYNQILNQQQYRKFNNIKQFNNKNKNNNSNLSMTTSMIQIPSGNSLDNQIEQISNLNTENSTNTNLSMSLNSDNLSSKNQSYYSNLSCAPISNYGNDIFINNINKPIPPSYISEQMYNFNRIPMNIFNLPMNHVNMEQNGMFNYPPFTMNSINQNNNMIINNNDNIKESKKKNNILGKNKGNRSNQGNKNLIPNNNNNTNLNFNNTINNGLFINQNQPVTHYKKNMNKKLGFRKFNSDKNIPLNNFSFIPQKNIINNNKSINQQKKDYIFPFNNLILKLKLPNEIESTDIININYLEADFHNIMQNKCLNSIINESIYNKIIMSLELANTIFSNNISKYERIKLDNLINYYNSQKDDDVLSNYSIEDILEYNKYYDMINDIKIDKNDIKNYEILNYTF